MRDINSIKKDINQLITDARVQLDSLQNEIKILPDTLQQLASNSQVIFDEARMKIEKASDKFIKENPLNKNYKDQIQNVVDKVHTSINQTLDAIKDAIEKAK